MSFSASASTPAVTVTVCTVFQFDVVKVSEVAPTVRSLPAGLVMATVTSPDGSVASFTV